MAARLTVVLSQAASRDSQMADLEETLVAELMMRPGLDATMIGPIERVQLDDTDFLCLSSFNHSFAFLSWLPSDELDSHWRRLSLSGSIVDVGSNERPPSAGIRCIYHVQLSPGLEPDQAVKSLSSILQDRNVKTVSIGLPGISQPESDRSAAMSPEFSEAAKVDDNGKQKLDKAKPSVEKTVQDEAQSPNTNRPAVTRRATAEEPDEEPEWDHLEKLVDDFDSLDL